jgi:acetyl-CoA carboxylase biotin carboxylase subunit
MTCKLKDTPLRITAEDPDREFAPSCGTITEWNPPINKDIRLETGVSEGTIVTPFYDPMIAKLIVTAENRQSAINKLSQALSTFTIQGIKTNIPFLRKLIETPSYREGAVDTTFVSRLLENQLTYAP